MSFIKFIAILLLLSLAYLKPVASERKFEVVAKPGLKFVQVAPQETHDIVCTDDDTNVIISYPFENLDEYKTKETRSDKKDEMHLESTHIDQTGIYYCNSADANQSNNEGKEMSSSLYLLVYDNSYSLVAKSNLDLNNHSTIEREVNTKFDLFVDIYGDSSVQVEWFFNGKSVNLSGPSSQLPKTEYVSQQYLKVIYHAIKFQHLNDEHSGFYLCKINYPDMEPIFVGAHLSVMPQSHIWFMGMTLGLLVLTCLVIVVSIEIGKRKKAQRVKSVNTKSPLPNNNELKIENDDDICVKSVHNLVTS